MKKNNNINIIILQLFRYFFVGGVAFIFDLGLLYLLTEYFNVNYLLSASIGFLFGLIVNYILSIKWVFNERAFENKSLEFFIFTLIGLIGLGINQFLIWLLTDVFLLYFMVSKIITASIVYFWNFFARKFLLFNKSQHNNE